MLPKVDILRNVMSTALSTVLILNGRVTHAAGYRQVVLDPDKAIREIVALDTKDEPHDATSVQIMHNGDLLVRLTWLCSGRKRFEPVWTVQRKSGASFTEIKNINKIIEAIPKEVRDEFLIPVGPAPSFLTSGPWYGRYYMNRVTLTEEDVRAYLGDIPNEWMEFLVFEALQSEASGLDTERTYPMPKTYGNKAFIWTDDSGEEIYTYHSQVWILKYDDDSVRLIDMEPTSGFESVGKDRRMSQNYSMPEKPMPASVVRAIRIDVGLYEAIDKDGKRFSYGCKWKQFVRR